MTIKEEAFQILCPNLIVLMKSAALLVEGGRIYAKPL